VSLCVTICHYMSLYVIICHTFTYFYIPIMRWLYCWLHLVASAEVASLISANRGTLHVAPRFPGHTFFVVDISQISRRVRCVRRLSGRDISSPSPDASHNRVHTRFDRIRTRFCGSLRCLNKIYDLKMLKSYCVTSNNCYELYESDKTPEANKEKPASAAQHGATGTCLGWEVKVCVGTKSPILKPT
jgi:hypothetical protein